MSLRLNNYIVGDFLARIETFLTENQPSYSMPTSMCVSFPHSSIRLVCDLL